MKVWYRCKKCAANIYVEQVRNYNELQYPYECYEEQGGCGKPSNFYWIKEPKTLPEWVEKIGKDKKCSRCHKIKPLSEFYIDRSTPDGVKYQCKSCSKKATTKYLAKRKKIKQAAGMKISNGTKPNAIPLVSSGTKDRTVI